MRKVKNVLVILLVGAVLSACATAQHRAAEDARSLLQGKSKKEILLCMGAPHNKEKVEDIEVWSYVSATSGAGVGSYSSVGTSTYSVGTGITSFGGISCTATIVFDDESRVINIQYSGLAGGPGNTLWACGPLVQNCVR